MPTTAKGRKRVTWFLPPELIRLVKAEAGLRDCDQSDIVIDALKGHLRQDGRVQLRPSKARAAR